MKHGTLKSRRRLLVAAFMLLSVMALNLPNGSSASATVTDSCSECGLQCANEAWWLKMQCMGNGGSESECNGTYDAYVRRCKNIFCNYGLGCDL